MARQQVINGEIECTPHFHTIYKDQPNTIGIKAAGGAGRNSYLQRIIRKQLENPSATINVVIEGNTPSSTKVLRNVRLAIAEAHQLGARIFVRYFWGDWQGNTVTLPIHDSTPLV